ncbi:MAG: toll/interleukin-1 receptor domain-containing protein [Promethearchaeota archaeon]
MAILEIGINLDFYNILEIKYYKASDDILDVDTRESLISELKTFTNKLLGDDFGVMSLASYELVCYKKEIPLPLDKKEKNVPLLLYVIIKKGTDIDTIKDGLKKLHSTFTNEFSPDEIITQNKDNFKRFEAQIDKIFDNIKLKTEEPIIFRGDSKTETEGIDKIFEMDELQTIIQEKISEDDQISKLLFSVYAPVSISPKSDFILNVWAYLSEQKVRMNEIASMKGDYVEKTQKGPIPAKIGDIFQVFLVLPEPLKIKDNIDTILWYGEFTHATFAVSVPKKAKPKSYNGYVKIFSQGIQLLRLDFTLKIGKAKEELANLTQSIAKFEKYFASYSSKDRTEVLKRVHGIRSIPGTEIFLDCLSIKQGDYWEKVIYEKILESDLFLLFWSKAASNSIWVKKELKFALKKRGLDFVQPIPLEDPQKVPPPKELASKHFNDLCLIALRS